MKSATKLVTNLANGSLAFLNFFQKTLQGMKLQIEPPLCRLFLFPIKIAIIITLRFSISVIQFLVF